MTTLQRRMPKPQLPLLKTGRSGRQAAAHVWIGTNSQSLLKMTTPRRLRPPPMMRVSLLLSRRRRRRAWISQTSRGARVTTLPPPLHQLKRRASLRKSLPKMTMTMMLLRLHPPLHQLKRRASLRKSLPKMTMTMTMTMTRNQRKILPPKRWISWRLK